MDVSFSNEYLRDFRPVFLGILKEKKLRPERVELEIIDEEEDGAGIFEPAGVREVLEQLAEDMNFLTIYTERPAYFSEFAETMYEENGLVVMIFPKENMFFAWREKNGAGTGGTLVIDFEWEGGCYHGQMCAGRYYIPIHKKPWRQAENLDIAVPIGYNTVIVKNLQERQKRKGRDRFEEAFYNA